MLPSTQGPKRTVILHTELSLLLESGMQHRNFYTSQVANLSYKPPYISVKKLLFAVAPWYHACEFLLVDIRTSCVSVINVHFAGTVSKASDNHTNA